jgi:hypothetical protein
MAKVKQSDAVSVAEAVERLPSLAVESDEDTLRRAVRVEDGRGVPQLAVVPWDLFECLRALATILQDPEWQATSRDAVWGLLFHLKHKYDLSEDGPNPSQLGPRGLAGEPTGQEAVREPHERRGRIYYSDEEFLDALRDLRPDGADV